MSFFASYSGVRITNGHIAIPRYGMWSGDVSLSEDVDVRETDSLVIGNLSMVGHVYRQAKFGGELRCRLIGGYGGWRTKIPKKQYSFNSGVKLSTVLKDAATESGEKIVITNDRVIGNGFVREEAMASRVLRQLAGEFWYIDPAGVTQVKDWPSKAIRSAFTVENQEGAQGRLSIATEDYASWLPGSQFSYATLDGTFTNGGVEFHFQNDGRLRLEVLTS